MPILLYIFAALLMIVVPLLVAAVVFFMRLPRWTDRILESDPATHDRLQLDVSEQRIGWTVSEQTAGQRLPYGPLSYATFTALVVTAIETALFSLNSGVPKLWHIAGIIAGMIVVVLTVVLVWILKRPFRRFVDRQFAQHADDRFAFAAQPIFETWWNSRQIDKVYGRIGLEARSDALEHSKRALLTYAKVGQDAALAEVIGVKNKAEHDLRNLEALARLYTSALTVLAQAKPDLQRVEELRAAVADIEQRLRSRELADARAKLQAATARQEPHVPQALGPGSGVSQRSVRAKWSAAFVFRSITSTLPLGAVPTTTTRKPAMMALAGFVPCADAGMSTTSRWPSPRAR